MGARSLTWAWRDEMAGARGLDTDSALYAQLSHEVALAYLAFLQASNLWLETRKLLSNVLNAEDRGEKHRRERISHEKVIAHRDDIPPLAARQKSFHAPILLHPRNGFIAAESSCTIEVRCQAASPGWQSYIVVVRNLKRDLNNVGVQKDHALLIK